VRFFYLQGVPNLGSLPPQIQEQLDKRSIVRPGDQNLTLWVGSHCSIVSSTLWSSNLDDNPPFPGGGFPPSDRVQFGMQLYDCASQS
jgi:hypothetical protein